MAFLFSERDGVHELGLPGGARATLLQLLLPGSRGGAANARQRRRLEVQEGLRFILAASSSVDDFGEDISDLLVDQLHERFMEEGLERRPASTREFMALPRVSGFQAAQYTEKCSICLEAFGKLDAAVVLPCDHCFHEACVAQWFGDRNSCPTCRRELKEQTAEEEEELRSEERRAFQEAILEDEGFAADCSACGPGEPCCFWNQFALRMTSSFALKDEEQRRSPTRPNSGGPGDFPMNDDALVAFFERIGVQRHLFSTRESMRDLARVFFQM